MTERQHPVPHLYRGRINYHQCPSCGRNTADTGTVYWSVPTPDGERHQYVNLRQHNRPEGGRCEGTTAPVPPSDDAPSDPL
jgi:hypothetical protein